MRRMDKQIHDQACINSILEENTVCRAALADGNKPYIIPMSYGFRDGFFFLHSALEGRKLDIIKRNSNICIEVTDSIEMITAEKGCNFGTKYRSVLCMGTVQILESPEEKTEGLGIIMKQHTGRSDWEFIPGSVENVAVLKVTVDTITGKISGF